MPSANQLLAASWILILAGSSRATMWATRQGFRGRLPEFAQGLGLMCIWQLAPRDCVEPDSPGATDLEPGPRGRSEVVLEAIEGSAMP